MSVRQLTDHGPPRERRSENEMSGIVGIVNLDGAPVEPRLLQRMTASLAFRGPDAQATWIEGCVGFGHTLLKTTFESEHERQPFTLDGEVWIVADARIDAQAELIRELTQHPACVGEPPVQGNDQDGRAASPATDVELILRAYHAWGESCVEYLLGDFAFAIWDGRERRLFCARDHFGIKPFYYAQAGNCVVFSNTLDCVRQHPAVSDRLNDLAVADFLVLEWNLDPATTAFADIQRLAPAHRATWSSAGLNLSRYWTLPIDEPLFYRRGQDYVDRFKDLLRQAITDRLRTRPVGILMSGGLDSPTLAATTRDVLREQYGSADLKAFTRLFPHGPDESYYAGLAAKSLGIPVHFQVEGEHADLNWERRRVHTPEPFAEPWETPAARDRWHEVGAYSRVYFFGEGPDNALTFEWRPYLRYLVRQHRYGRLLQAFLSAASHGPIPFWGRLPRRMEELRTGWTSERNFPPWLNPELESRLGMRARWEDFLRPLTSAHPVRPEGYASMLIPLWQNLLESLDAEWTNAALELRHPYLDSRLLRFMLAVPALPWCRSKYLLRRIVRGVLPEPLLSRPKEGVPTVPCLERLTPLFTLPFVPAPDLGYYIEGGKLPNARKMNVWAFGDYLRVRALNYWLQNSRGRFNITPTEDRDYECFAESADSNFGEKAV